MDNTVANPIKELFVKNPLDEVRAVIKRIPATAAAAKLKIENDTMNFYQFDVAGKGRLNLGVFIEISLHECASGTRLIIEGRRKIGAVNNFAEIDETYAQLFGTISMIGKGLLGEL